MVKINLHQPGHLNLNISFPSDWNELFPAELLEVCKEMLKPEAEQLHSRARLLKFIIDYRTKLSKQRLPSRWMNMVDAEQAVLLGLPLLDFLYKENNLTKNPEERINLGWNNKVWGPKNFSTITCGEFEDAEIFFNKFFTDPKGEDLAQLAAIFWRKKDVPYIKFNVRTQRFKNYDPSRTAKCFLRLDPARLYTIFVWYAGNRSELPKLFPTVHEGDGDKKAPDMLAFTKCIHAAAGPKNGSRQDIRMMPLYELMFEMEQEAIKANELAASYKSR